MQDGQVDTLNFRGDAVRKIGLLVVEQPGEEEAQGCDQDRSACEGPFFPVAFLLHPRRKLKNFLKLLAAKLAKEFDVFLVSLCLSDVRWRLDCGLEELIDRVVASEECWYAYPAAHNRTDGQDH